MLRVIVRQSKFRVLGLAQAKSNPRRRALGVGGRHAWQRRSGGGVATERGKEKWQASGRGEAGVSLERVGREAKGGRPRERSE